MTAYEDHANKLKLLLHHSRVSRLLTAVLSSLSPISASGWFLGIYSGCIMFTVWTNVKSIMMYFQCSLIVWHRQDLIAYVLLLTYKNEKLQNIFHCDATEWNHHASYISVIYSYICYIFYITSKVNVVCVYLYYYTRS